MGFTAPGVVFVPTDGSASAPPSIREHALARRKRTREREGERQMETGTAMETTRVASLDEESLENV